MLLLSCLTLVLSWFCGNASYVFSDYGEFVTKRLTIGRCRASCLEKVRNKASFYNIERKRVIHVITIYYYFYLLKFY